MKTRTVGALAVTMFAVSCAPYGNQPQPAQQANSLRKCFYLSQVNGYTYAGDNKIHVSLGPGETYEFKMLGPCPDLDYGENIALAPVGPGPICQGMDVELIVPSDIGPKRCPVEMIRKLENKPKQKAAE